MELKIYVFALQCLIFWHRSRHQTAMALIGRHVRQVEENEFNSVACLIQYNPGLSWQETMFCTGTFISNSHVLTAEHCAVNINDMVIVIGSHDIEHGVRYNPIWWIAYEQWMHSNNRLVTTPNNDILILKVIGLTDRIVSSELSFIRPNSLLYGSATQVVGCGYIHSNDFPTVLHTGPVKIISLNDCINLISSLEGLYLPLTDNILCTVGNPYLFLHYGDSGGPLFYQNRLVAVNIAVCPITDEELDPMKVNIHVSINTFQEFFNVILNE